MSSSLDHPFTRKPISIALALALRACEAAWARDASGVAGRGGVQFVGVVRPVGRPAGIFRSSLSRAKTTPLCFVRLLLAASRC